MRPFVPEEFLNRIKAEHPPGNKPIFEEWFFDNRDVSPPHNRIYLPIFWTSFYVNNNYGNDEQAKQRLQYYLDHLDASKKYYTLLQYDDGVLNDVSGLDIKVFGSGGGRIDFPIPLICHPHPYTFDIRCDVFASFAGSMTHPIRRKMVQNFRHRYKIHMKHLPIKDYCELMARSIFSLAPRGY